MLNKINMLGNLWTGESLEDLIVRQLVIDHNTHTESYRKSKFTSNRLLGKIKSNHSWLYRKAKSSKLRDRRGKISG
jgi:hypothetical protein